MEKFVMGTAGHIDHGKTTLIKSLTGIETDTTDEEKSRGMSINLGFAYLDLPNGERLGIVDVPGHEKFIKNMVAGASGIDFALLVIDVNEGIMPQTKEHIDILTLLGLNDFIIAITKAGGVEEELLEIVIEDIKEQFENTTLAQAPILVTDAVTGLGLKELKETIMTKCARLESDDIDRPARLNIDRAFSVRGFGTVVTGTLIEGRIQVGDRLNIYPKGIETTVRSIQIHEEDQKEARAGNRTALNLTKVGLDEVSRGDVISAAPLRLTWMIDVKLKCLETARLPIELWDRVHLNIGTREVLARVVPLGQDRILPGEEGFAQLRLEEQLAVKKDDHFIIRQYSPVITIGGGTVLDANPEKHKRFNENILESLKVKESGQEEDILLDFLISRSYGLTSVKEMSEYLNISQKQVQKFLDELSQRDDVKQFGQYYMARQRFDEFSNEMEALVVNYHQKHSLRSGMPVEEFRSTYNKIPVKELDTVLKTLTENGILLIDKQYIRHRDFKIEMTDDQAGIKEEILKILKTSAMTPPTVEELTHYHDPEYDAVLNLLLDSDVKQVDRYTFLLRSVYEQAIADIISFIEQNGSITLAQTRDLFDTSRKFALKILEHLDDQGITKRKDDVRVLK